MSLLNDALRAAEQRQEAPKGSRVYVGLGTTAPRRRRAWVFVLAVAVLTGAGLLVAHTLRSPATEARTPAGADAAAGGMSEPPITVAGPSPSSERAAPVSAAVPAAVPAPAEKAPSNEPSAARAPQPVVAEPKALANAATVSRVPAQPSSGNRVSSGPARTDQAPVDPAPVSTAPVAKTPVEAAPTDATPKHTAPPVKQLPDTPDQRDRQMARSLRSLLNAGNVDEAETRLQALVEAQPAPRSRSLLARELLARQRIGDALTWLPEAATRGQPELRLLRARALLADHRPKEAQALLQSDLPPVDQWPAYRVTLATLLQRNGDSQSAVVQWTRLLASDDSQGAWWVGLGIALEDLGKLGSARQAYAQAAALPGLPSALSRYVNQRLDALQAGS